GDRKQSIYGFRGADVAIFARTCVELAGERAAAALSLAATDAGDRIADFVALQTSRRSGDRVLAFVNPLSAFDFAAGASLGPPSDFEIRYGRGEVLGPAGEGVRGEVVLVTDDGSAADEIAPVVRGSAGAARE